MNMRAIIAGTEPFKLRLYSGHDGSMIRLASGLGLGKPESDGRLRWPALGGEIIFEVGANVECKCGTEQSLCRFGSSPRSTRRTSCSCESCMKVHQSGR